MRFDYCEYQDGPQSYQDVTGKRILCKGGSGDDGGASQREAQRQRRIAEGTDQVNRIFGIGDSDAAAARQSIYDTTKEDTRQYLNNQLETNKADALRQLNFQKARQGIIGSSQANDIDSQFQKKYDEGLLQVANKADEAATGLRTNDEQTRLNLIAKVVAGMDQGSAAQNAISALQTNADSAKQAAYNTQMANVFSDLLNGYNTSQYNSGVAAAKNGSNSTGNYFTTDNSVSGTTTKS